MIHLLDLMEPVRSGSHCGVRAPGGVTHPDVASSESRKGTKSVCLVMPCNSIFEDPRRPSKQPSS